jgi:hypothetical protein
VAARPVARFDAEHLARDDIRAMHHHETMDRSHEFRIARSPAHHLRNRQVLDRILYFAFEAGAEMTALGEVAMSKNFLLAVVDPNQPIN